MTGPAKLGSLGVTALALAHLVSSGVHHLQQKRMAALMAEQIMQQAELVVVDPSVPADIVSSLRRSGPERQFVVFRAAAAKSAGVRRSEQIRGEIEQAQRALARPGVRYVIATEADSGPHGENSLLATLRWNPRFKLLGAYPIPNGTGRRTRNLYLYESTEMSSGDEKFGSAIVAQR